MQYNMENVTRNNQYENQISRPASRSNLDQDAQMQENTFSRPQPVHQL